MGRRPVWRLPMARSEVETCLPLGDRPYVIIALQYIFRNFFVELAIKLLSSIHILSLTNALSRAKNNRRENQNDIDKKFR